jgi:hypothetical protein
MYCERDGRRLDLSGVAHRSCGSGLCGGWRYFGRGGSSGESRSAGVTGAWLPVISVCGLGLYADPAPGRASPQPPVYSSSSSSSSGSSLPAVVFVVQPQAMSVPAGAAGGLFSVVVSAPGAVVYRWQHSVDGGVVFFDINPHGGVFLGAEGDSLSVYAGMTDGSSVWNGARFRCRVSYAGEDFYSGAGVLTVV